MTYPTPTDVTPQPPTVPRHRAPATNTMAILSLVFSFVFWPLGIIFGHVALKQIRHDGDTGRGLAITGLTISYVAFFFAVMWVLFVARF